MTYELLAKKGYKRRGEVIESEIDFQVERVCSMTPNQALAILQATGYAPGRSKVVAKCGYNDALDSYQAAVVDYINHGNRSHPVDPDKPFEVDRWGLVRNICVDCLGMVEWFNQAETVPTNGICAECGAMLVMDMCHAADYVSNPYCSECNHGGSDDD